MNPILITGVEHHNVYGVLRALHKKGLTSQVHLLLTGAPPRYIHLSEYIPDGRISYVPGLEHLVDAMNSMGFEEKVVVICCSDASIAYLDEHKDLLDERFVLPSASGTYGGIHQMMSKAVQARIASDAGLSCPVGYILAKGEEVPDNLPFPCIVKPMDSVTAGKSEICICDDRKALESALERSCCQELFVQEFIIKKMEFQLIGCAVDGGRSVVIPGYTRIIRQPANTNTGFLEYVPMDQEIDADTLNGVKRMIAEMGYEGLFSVEFVQDHSGRNLFMEMNMRNDGNAVCVTDAGCNLPYIWYASSCGMDWTEEAHRSVKRLYCMPVIPDMTMMLKGKVSPLTWIKDVRKTTSFMDYSREDRRPFARNLALFAGFLVKRLLRIR